MNFYLQFNFLKKIVKNLHLLFFQNLTEKTRRLVSPSQEKELQMTNSNLAEELQKAKYQASHMEQTTKKLREEKLTAEKERDHVVEQNKSLSISIEVHRLPLTHLINYF